MTELAITLAIILVVAYISWSTGYYIGRHQVVKEIREMTKELNKGE